MAGQDDPKPGEGWVKREDRKLRDLTVTVYPRDLELLEWLCGFLGCSKSEANRTAIRSFAGQMKALEKEVGRPRGS